MKFNIGFFGMLALIFITLKLLGHITWSWLWVLSPLVCPLVFIGISVFCGLFIVAIAASATQR